jgi:hypothetical protein
MAPFVLYTAVMSADSAPAAVVETGPAVFPATTPFYATRNETLEIHAVTRATFDGVIDGDVGYGTVYWIPGTHHVGAGTSISFDKGTPMPTMPGNTSDIIDILGIIAAIVLSALIIARHDIRAAQLNDLACRVVENAARLLPPSARETYLEEWTTWLQDLRTNGAPWHRRLAEVLSIVFVAAPRLALTLRWFPRRPVDR